MSDSDDENYVNFGVALEPLDEDNLPRKRAITAADQCVYDTEGRRRFHGAFTGGFSAGYFNGVGSRDGWTPKRFKSSRAERTVGVVQRPQDFMDEEDTGQFGIAPTAIRTTGGYQDLDKDKSSTLRRRQAQQGVPFQDGSIPGAPVLGEILRPVRDTVGVILLKKMGWRPGQGVGARVTKRQKLDIRKRNDRMKVYGCAKPPGQDAHFSTSTDESGNEDEDDDGDENSTITFAPDDYEPFRRDPKDNLFGIGYTGLDRHTVLSDSRDRRVVLAESFFRQEKDRKIAKHGRAFGVGAFEEEDDDIYAQDDMSRYDFTLAPAEDAGKKSARKRERVSTNTASSCIEGFVRASYALHQPDADAANETTRRRRKFFPPPALPANFNPAHATSRFSPHPVPVKIEKRAIRNADDRAVMLDEKSRTALSTNERKTMDGAEGRKDEKKLEKESEKERPKGAASWLEKLQGSHTFVAGGLLAKSSAEKKEEVTEVEGSSKTESVELPSADDGIDDSRRKAAKLKMFGKLTRERMEWRACSIVYKRFNIQEPKAGAKVESGTQRKPVKFSLLSKSIDFLSAGNEKKEIVWSGKTGKTDTTKKTEMQLVEEASHSESQSNERIETAALPTTEAASSSQSSVLTPFEVSYEKIFGKAISGDDVGRSKTEPSEKKDLFKAIFVDSDDDDHLEEEKEEGKENDGKEDDQEAVKSVLIGSNVEAKPSFSPPRGIFSNLDKLERPKQERESAKEKETTEKKCDSTSPVLASTDDPGILSENIYGPALPSTSADDHHHGLKVEDSNKPVIFKSVAIPSRSETAIEERWVEVKKGKKSKKEKKKKRKHKESKKSKKESSRKRRH